MDGRDGTGAFQVWFFETTRSHFGANGSFAPVDGIIPFGGSSALIPELAQRFSVFPEHGLREWPVCFQPLQLNRNGVRLAGKECAASP